MRGDWSTAGRAGCTAVVAWVGKVRRARCRGLLKCGGCTRTKREEVEEKGTERGDSTASLGRRVVSGGDGGGEGRGRGG